jgi:hypothetical protein
MRDKLPQFTMVTKTQAPWVKSVRGNNIWIEVFTPPNILQNMFCAFFIMVKNLVGLS